MISPKLKFLNYRIEQRILCNHVSCIMTKVFLITLIIVKCIYRLKIFRKPTFLFPWFLIFRYRQAEKLDIPSNIFLYTHTITSLVKERMKEVKRGEN